MKIVLQRVSEASVEVSGRKIGSIGKGLLLLVGAENGDTEGVAERFVDRCLGIRIFEDDKGKMNLSVKDIEGEIMAVSQFTLAADISKGRRPGFSTAMEPKAAEELFEYFVGLLRGSKLKVKTGEFGAKMKVGLMNDGPVTFILER